MNGNKLRKLRKEKGLTIKEISAQCGFSSSYISQIERSIIDPSLTALNKICKALDTSVYYFLEDNEGKYYITRKNDRQKLYIPEDSQEIEFIIPIKDNKASKFGIYEVEIEPSKWDCQNYRIIDCEKCVIVKRGTILFNLNDQSDILQEGDSVFINKNLPHKFYNPTDNTAQIICVTLPSEY